MGQLEHDAGKRHADVYQINQLAPTTFGFVNNPDAVHKNTYSSLIMGARRASRRHRPRGPAVEN